MQLLDLLERGADVEIDVLSNLKTVLPVEVWGERGGYQRDFGGRFYK